MQIVNSDGVAQSHFERGGKITTVFGTTELRRMARLDGKPILLDFSRRPVIR